MIFRTSEFRKAALARHNFNGAAILGRAAVRSAWARLRGPRLAIRGETLVARLLLRATQLGAEVWTDSPVRELEVDRGAVKGVVVERDGAPVRVLADRGVLLAAGGYARNDEMRTRFARQPSESAWTKANEGETGEVLGVSDLLCKQGLTWAGSPA